MISRRAFLVRGSRSDALLVLSDPLTNAARQRINHIAIKNRLPAAGRYRFWARVFGDYTPRQEQVIQ